MPSFYKGQEAAIEQIHRHFLDGKRYVILEGPTGSGKSAIAVTFARQFGAYMLTSQKLLQQQYANDFGRYLAVVKGRNAYHCACAQTWADVAPCVEKKRKTLDPCPINVKGEYLPEGEVGPACDYARALLIGKEADITLFNYHAFYAHSEFAPRDLLILDEAHNLESITMDMVQITLDSKDIPLHAERDVTSLMEGLMPEGVYVKALRRVLAELSVSVATSTGAEKTRAFRRQNQLQSLIQKIVLIRGMYIASQRTDYQGPLFEEMWVLKVDSLPGKEDKPTKIAVKPVFAGSFVPQLFLRRGKRCLFMSATILDKDVFCESIGIKPKDAAFVTMACNFPVENRLVHVYPCGELSYKEYSKGIRGVLDGIRRVIEHHKGQRGIIHTHSWKVLKDIQQNIHSPRLIFQDPKVRNREDCIEALKASDDGILVAPAMHEGLDLKDDFSRFQIVTKIPWPDFGDPQIQARARVDDRWYAWQTCLKFVQSAGRSVRSAQDWASTYVLDSAFGQFWSRTQRRLEGKLQSMLPAWFIDALRVYEGDETKAFLRGDEDPCNE